MREGVEMEPMEIVERRQIALRLAMEFVGKNEGDEKQVIDVAKRFDHFLSTGSQGRDRTLSIVQDTAAEE